MTDEVKTVNVSAERLHELIKNKLLLAGLTEEQAEETTRHLVYADMIGVHSHGAVRVEYYSERINKGGIIKSVRGPGGGYKLNCVPSDTPLRTIFELLGGAFESRGCGMDGCKGYKCFIGDMLDELTLAFIKYLEARSFADFIEYYEGKIPVKIELSVITPSLGQKHPNF